MKYFIFICSLFLLNTATADSLIISYKTKCIGGYTSSGSMDMNCPFLSKRTLLDENSFGFLNLPARENEHYLSQEYENYEAAKGALNLIKQRAIKLNCTGFGEGAGAGPCN
jgi:hypothetical protein